MSTDVLTGYTIGFVGLGLMGRPMSLHLLRAGAGMVIHNRSREVIRTLTEEGMRAALSPREVAEQAPIIVLMLSDTPAVEQVIAGDDGILSKLRPGSLVIDMGTTAVTPTRRLAERVRDAGGDFVDAPVSGGQVGAEAANLTIMAGGEEAAFERARPIFGVLGANITHVGAIGAGQVAKAANQMIVGLAIGAVAEALTLARRAGVDPARVRQALAGGFAWSRVLELHGERMIERRFAPGGKATTQRKDMQQALALGAELDLALPATALNKQLYDRLVEMGGGSLDHSALIKVIEDDGRGSEG